MTERIDQLEGRYFFLSNYYNAPVEFEGIEYPTCEHAFQAAKSLDTAVRKSVSKCYTPDGAKYMGRNLHLRPDWEKIKIDIMTTIVRNKFSTHDDLRKRLLQTGNAELIEGNTWNDIYWGKDIRTGKGENNLGIILMKIRKEIQNGEIKDAGKEKNSKTSTIKNNTRQYYYEINRKVMDDTQELCETIPTLKSAVEKSINKEYIVYQEDKIETNITKNKNRNMKIIVSKERTFEAAKKYKGKKICCLDFANNHCVGGAPWIAGAQEESMCRTSTLYPCLFVKREEFYEKHRKQYDNKEIDNLGNDDLIYVPEVVVFKTDESEPKLEPEHSWFKTDVIVSAAPMLNSTIGKITYKTVMESRIKKILDVASKEKVEVIILGAFGCGAFGNPPDVVADIFASLIKDYDFEIVEFAIFCYNDTTNYDIFKKKILG